MSERLLKPEPVVSVSTIFFGGYNIDCMTLDEKLRGLPTEPGVYLHKGAGGEIIYIGKAKSLRHRVRQYFQASRGMDAKTQELVSRIVTEAEAIIKGRLARFVV